MKKMVFILNGLALALHLGAIAVLAEDGELWRSAQGKQPIKVFIKEFNNEADKSEIGSVDFVKVLESAFTKRRSLAFTVVNSPEASEYQIFGTIKKYLYSQTDPVTSFGSPTGMILDAMTTENYAEMKVDFIITDTKTGKNVWQGEISDFVKHKMSKKESLPLIFDKVSRTFLRKSFGKPK